MYSYTLTVVGNAVRFLIAAMLKNMMLVCFMLTIFLSFLIGSAAAQEHSYEAEDAVLSDGASVQNCGSCSGGKQVGNLGGSSNGAISQIVEVDGAADYDLTLSYSSGDPRTIYLIINDGSPVEVTCEASGGWTTVATTELQVGLNDGTNTIKFYNDGGWAPNIDKFSLTPSPLYSISGTVVEEGIPMEGIMLTLTGAASGTTATDENGFYEFTDLSSDKNYTITPSAADKIFTPVYSNYDRLGENKINQDFVAEAECSNCSQSFTFGIDGEIVYSTQNGTATIYWDGSTVISNAHAVVFNGSTKLSSMDYTNRSISQSDINDAFGTGKKVVVNLSADGLPNMQHVFYTYTDKNYFLTEVLINGEEVSSNYMAPLVSNKVDIGEAGDNRVLFVPFDNDTFIKYKSLENSRTNTSSEVTAFYENNSRNGLVVGSVEHTDWKTGVKTNGSGSTLSELTVWGGYTDVNVTRDAISHGSISGASVKSPKIFVGLFDDWRIGLEEYGKATAMAEPRYVFDWEGPTPFGWNSWGAVQTDLNLDNAKAVVNFFSTSLPAFRNGETAYIDLDSYWDNMISGGLEGDFSALISFVNYCKDKGLKPGIYWAPFVDWGKTDRRVEGSTYNYSDVWTKVNGAYHDLDGARAMDPTHPATQQRINLVIDKFKACGFEMIKIDFIGHAAIEADIFYDPSVETGMQAFRKGMEYLIDRLDGKMLVYAAISPSLATGRYAHTRRIACDAYADINATEYTLNSTTYGWWQTYIYNYIDADHIVFGDESLGENRARLTSGLINGTLITGDDFSKSGQWRERAKALLQNQDLLDIARNGVAFRPVEGSTEQGASEVFVNKIGDDYYVAVINYGGQKSYELNLSRLGIASAEYGVRELFTRKWVPITGSALSVNIDANDAAVFKFTEGVVSGAISDPPADTFILYPNPTTAALTVSSSEGIRSLKIFSLKGEVLAEIEGINSDNYAINMSGYKSGVYVVRLIKLNGKVANYKVIKEQ